MIVNIADKKTFKFLKFLMIFLQRVYHDLFYRKFINRLFHDSNQLNKFFRHKYPSLKLDQQGNSSCVSCDLCQEVCPSNSIKIEKANLMNFPSSLKSGEAPLHFYLNVDSCTKCHLCADVCVVSALELSSSYNEKLVDLVVSKEDEIDHSESKS